jgi:hypothetical protein
MTEGAWEKAENTGEARAFALAPLKNKILIPVRTGIKACPELAEGRWVVVQSKVRDACKFTEWYRVMVV